jgi:hypothetical protein
MLNVLVFFLGLLVFTIVLIGVLLFYLPAYQEEARRDGVELPAAVRWCMRVVGLEPAAAGAPPRP